MNIGVGDDRVPVLDTQVVTLAFDPDIAVPFRNDAVKVFGARVSESLSFLPEDNTRLIAVTLGRQAQGVPALNYSRVWLFLSLTTQRAKFCRCLRKDMTPLRACRWGGNHPVYEFVMAEGRIDGEPAMSFVMTAGAFDRQACIGEGDVCPEGQRCKQVDGNNTFKCVPHQGIRVARATFRMNANMENIENPWQSTALQLGARDWSMRWAAGQTLVTWIEEESPRLPMRMNLGEFSLDTLFCQDRGDSCASVYDDIAGARDERWRRHQRGERL